MGATPISFGGFSLLLCLRQNELSVFDMATRRHVSGVHKPAELAKKPLPRRRGISYWTKLRKLNYSSVPFRALPHGFCGIVNLVSGLVLIFGSLFGDTPTHAH